MTAPKLTISASSQTMPPPYAFDLEMTVVANGTDLETDFSMVYTGREDLTEDEIFGEGFTQEDDVKWVGKLGNQWWDVVASAIAKTNIKKGKKNNESDPLQVELTTQNMPSGVNIVGSPTEYGMWEYLIQELIQAVFEASERELPLSLNILKITGTVKQEIKIKAKFSTREATIELVGKSKAPETLEWSALKDYLKIVYQPDYLPEKEMNKAPKNAGIYFSFIEGSWYELKKGIVEPSKKSTTLVKIEKLVDQILND
jgi:hypothetical protein